jgi:hypothetical protein
MVVEKDKEIEYISNKDVRILTETPPLSHICPLADVCLMGDSENIPRRTKYGCRHAVAHHHAQDCDKSGYTCIGPCNCVKVDA